MNRTSAQRPMTASLSLGSAACVLLALGPTSPAAARPFERPVIQVLEQSADRTVVHLQWGEQRVPTFDGAFAVAVPGAGGATVRVLSLRTLPAEDDVLAHWGQAFAVDRPTAGEPAGSALPPLRDRPVEVTSARRFRGAWIVTAQVWAVFRPAPGAPPVRVVDLVVALEHAAAGAPDGSGAQLGSTPATTPAQAWLASTVVNPVSGARFAAAAAAREAATRPAGTLPVADTFAHSDRWLRLEIVATGLYAVTFEDLDLLVGDGELIDPATFRLFAAPSPEQPELPEDARGSWNPSYELQERSLLVEAAGARLAPGDRVLFYVTGPSDWSDRYDPAAGVRDHFEQQFSDRLAYWLTWDADGGAPGDFASPPLRMLPLDGSTLGTPDRIATTYRERVHMEQNRTLAYGEVRDNWLWEPRIQRGQELSFAFPSDNVVADSTGWLYTEPLADPVTSNVLQQPVPRVEFRTAQGLLQQFSWDILDQNDPAANPPIRASIGGLVPAEGGDALRIRNVSDGAGAGGSAPYPIVKLDFFSVTYRRVLALRAGELAWAVYADEVPVPQRLRFQLAAPSWPGTRYLLDTTDPVHPRRITDAGAAAGVLSFELDLQANVRRHLACFQPSAVRRPDRLRARRPVPLRSQLAEGGGYDYVVLAPPSLLPAAEDLAQLRSQLLAGPQGEPLLGPRAAAFDLQDIYDSFGHGVKEPAAIRNFLKFVYQLPVGGDPARRLAYAEFMGDASRDYQNRAGRDPNGPEIDRCPTFVQTLWPLSVYAGNLQYVPYAADDWLGCFDDRPPPSFNSFPIDLPEVAVGRMPVGNLAEARAVVARTIAYETAPPAGAWRNSILLVADDEVCLARACCYEEADHINEAEIIAEGDSDQGGLLPAAVDVSKLYLTEYPVVPGSRTKPRARDDMRNAWSAGQLIVHYIGHGSPEQLADETVFRIEDVGLLTNGDRRPLFLAFSCDVAVFDDNATKSMSEQMVLDPAGGAIAAIAATQVTYIGPNEELTNAFYPRLFPGGVDGRSVPLGSALLGAKVAASSGGWFNQQNDQKYELLGDVALQLQAPSQQLAMVDSLVAAIDSGHLLEVRAQAQRDGAPRTDFDGRYHLEAREARDRSGYTTTVPEVDLNNDGFPDCGPAREFSIAYALDGASFFRGDGAVTAGAVAAQLLAPLTMRFGTDGRIRLLAESGGEQVVALAEPVPVRRVSTQSDDRVGPQIDLAFEDAGGDRAVLPGAVLVATLTDPSGINVRGVEPASGVQLQLDDSGILSDVTDAFVLDDGRFDRGSVRFTLPAETTTGPHRAELTASDMLGNIGKASLRFTVVDAQAPVAAEMFPFPNPFQTTTRFVMEGPAAALSRVELDIFAVDGTPVRTLRQATTSPGQVVIEWDGRDARGDEIANGVYLYTVHATESEPPNRTHVATGRVVRMR